jgi:hypothetical protein
MPEFAPTAFRELLVQRVQDLSRELEALCGALQVAVVPLELEPYRTRLLRYAKESERWLAGINRDLTGDVDEILEDLRSSTAQATEIVCLLSRVLAAPVLAASVADRLWLRLIQWMHASAHQTVAFPAACCDGDPQVWPFLLFAPLYSFPNLVRRGVLYMPVLFHEFGHVLYRLHRPELDDLVEELQRWIQDELEPLSRRNDELARRQRELQRDIVDTWYAWTQELFCDAVGLLMAGPAYLHAFNSYLSRLERSDLTRPLDDLAGSSHPVLWLRIKLLNSFARRLGYDTAAERHERNWATLAAALKVAEDYFGFFEDIWQTKVEAVIRDMLTETAPRPCRSEEAEPHAQWHEGDSPIRLMNSAWERFLVDPAGYPIWETAAIGAFLSQPTNI